jgi:hypothetical protein
MGSECTWSNLLVEFFSRWIDNSNTLIMTVEALWKSVGTYRAKNVST